MYAQKQIHWNTQTNMRSPVDIYGKCMTGGSLICKGSFYWYIFHIDAVNTIYVYTANETLIRIDHSMPSHSEFVCSVNQRSRKSLGFFTLRYSITAPVLNHSPLCLFTEIQLHGTQCSQILKKPFVCRWAKHAGLADDHVVQPRTSSFHSCLLSRPRA